MVRFNVTKKQEDLITLIADRAKNGVFQGHTTQDHLSITMDLSATIAQGCDIDLEKLLAFDDFNFNHDVGGIYLHINLTTGLLENCFLPRCAR